MNGPTRRLAGLGCIATLLAVVSFSYWAGARGIDFGDHWDEWKVLEAVDSSLCNQFLLLPRWYNYPSVSYAIALGTAIPEAAQRARAVAKLPKSDEVSRLELLYANLRAFPTSAEFKLRVRRVFLCIALASLLFVYWLVLRWRHSHVEALIGAAILGLSWEFVYHARWIAPDAILVSFTIGSIAFLMHALGDAAQPRRWLLAAAAAAGVACGTKYPGGMLLVPLLLGTRLLAKRRALQGSPRGLVVTLLAVFVVTFVITTPGILLDPVNFLRDVRVEMHHYRTGHYGYTVRPIVEHLPLLLVYLSTVAMSHYRAVAVLLFGLGLVGAYAALRDDRGRAMVFLAFPLVYMLYMGSQRVLIVRNYLVLLPFLAALAAHGWATLSRLGSRRWQGAFLALLVLVPATLNARWLVRSAESAHDHSTIDHRSNVLRYLERRPAGSFYLTDSLSQLLAIEDRAKLPLAASPGPGITVVFLSSEVVDRSRWRANHLGLYEIVSGPDECNFDYYPTWSGDGRVVALPTAAARSLGVVP